MIEEVWRESQPCAGRAPERARDSGRSTGTVKMWQPGRGGRGHHSEKLDFTRHEMESPGAFRAWRCAQALPRDGADRTPGAQVRTRILLLVSQWLTQTNTGQRSFLEGSEQLTRLVSAIGLMKNGRVWVTPAGGYLGAIKVPFPG